MALLGCPQLTMTRTLSAMPNWLKKWFSSDYLKVRTKVVKWIYLAVSMDNASVQLGVSWGVDADGAGIEEAGSESESEDDLDDYERRKAQKSGKKNADTGNGQRRSAQFAREAVLESRSGFAYARRYEILHRRLNSPLYMGELP